MLEGELDCLKLLREGNGHRCTKNPLGRKRRERGGTEEDWKKDREERD